MHQRRPLGVFAARHTRDDRHHARTDVRTQRDIDTLVERDKSRHYHRDGYRGHHRRRLDDGGEERTYHHQQNRIAYRGKELLHSIQLGEVFHRTGHHAQADKQHTETCDDTTHFLPHIVLGKQADERTYTRQRSEDSSGAQPAAGRQTEGDNLRRDGGTDVGTIDNRGGLRQRHDTYIHETNHHHGGGTGRLY